MPQLFQVLRCYKCLVFQVHQTKKSNKFQCKMCGEKQSLKRHYGLGNGQECRLHVQKLNSIRGKETKEEVVTSENSEEEFEDKESKVSLIPKLESLKSKWSAFVNDEDKIPHNENETSTDNENTLSEKPKKRKKYSHSTDNLMLLPQMTSVDKRKFDTPYKWKGSKESKQIGQEVSNQETSKNLAYKQKCNELSNTLNNVQGSVKGKSKWAQFVVAQNEHQENLQEPSASHCANNNSRSCKTNNLFEQCNDTDLDKILNI